MSSQFEIVDNTGSEEKEVNDIIFILDRSGSMSSMGTEPQDSLNNFIEEQKDLAKKLKDGSRFTLYTFNDKTDVVMREVPLEQAVEYTTFVPSGMTKLYDTIGTAINSKLTKQRSNNVICVILTDGADNSSKTYTAASIKKLMGSAETEHGWKFMFLAANQDAFESGRNIGVSNNRCSGFEATPEGMRGVCRKLSGAVQQYRSATNSGLKTELSMNHSNSAPPTVGRKNYMPSQ